MDRDAVARLLRKAETERVCARGELVGARPQLGFGVAAGLLVVTLAGCAGVSPVPLPELAPAEVATLDAALGQPDEGQGNIAGFVRDAEGIPVEGAVVTAQSVALDQTREVLSDARGVYVFRGLPPGTYTIDARSGETGSVKVVELRANDRCRTNLRLGPVPEVIVGMVVVAPRAGEAG